ncbi:hypothetical protein AWB74_01379 [Caballeronia arvi]|uniref:ScyD/ScyE family protein n=2 Tax=Caballeronia arvi TaxID=1777135 RepID=A0A158GN69_9BURK|nr:hypothetical protein AWB74_01379 [Caballeronia arvi]
MMKRQHRIRSFVACALSAVSLAFVTSAYADGHADSRADDDVLAIGDWGDVGTDGEVKNSTVQFLSTRTGNVIARLPDDSGGLHGPNGILFDEGRMIVANQNAGTEFSGAVIQFGRDVRPGAPIVSADDPHAPFAPRGIVLLRLHDGSRLLFIADLGDATSDAGPVEGKLLVFRVTDNHVRFRGDLNPNLDHPGTIAPEFHPRGIVLGPDGYLYVSYRYLPNPCGGGVARFDPVELRFKDIVLQNSIDCKKNANNLHRPEGLVFAPNGDLFITSFRADMTDLDRILIVRAEERISGQFRVDPFHIELDQANAAQQTSAQAIVFGPGGYLYVPIFQTGEVRKYDVVTGGYWTFAPAGTLKVPQYLSFTRTDPATLAYGERDRRH